MATQRTSSKAIHVIIWIAQVVLATGFTWAACMILFQPAQKLAAMWPWTGQIPTTLVKRTGVIDLLAAAGLILPSLLRIRPKLTPVAAICIIGLMVSAGIFHIARGEASVIGVNIFFAAMAAFVAWGRFRKTPIAAK